MLQSGNLVVEGLPVFVQPGKTERKARSGALQDKRGTQKGRQELNSDLAVVGWRETRIGGRDKLSSKLHARLLSACEGFVSKGEIQPFERF